MSTVTYRLKEQVTDLSRHRAQEHVRTPAGARRFGLSIGSPIGKHLRASHEVEAKTLGLSEMSFESHARSLDMLMQRVNNETPETIHENTWDQVSVHLEQMSKIAKSKQIEIDKKRRTVSVQATSSRVDRTLYSIKTKVSPAPEKPKEFGKEFLSHAANREVVKAIATYGVNFAAAAVSLIGAQQSDHLSETFRHFLENPAAETGLAAAVSLAITALVTAIRRALKKRRDAKIAKARGIV